MTKSTELVIDPVAQNIVNRIAAGSVHKGTFRWNGGLLVQGRIEGDIEITGGPLILMEEGEIAGTIRGDGDAVLLGTILHKSPDVLSELDIEGCVVVAQTARAHATIRAGSYDNRNGGQVEGSINTWRRDASRAPA